MFICRGGSKTRPYRIIKFEWKLYPECIQLFAQGRLKVVHETHTLENGTKVERRVVEIETLQD